MLSEWDLKFELQEGKVGWEMGMQMSEQLSIWLKS
jgi:hypothetical protein